MNWACILGCLDEEERSKVFSKLGVEDVKTAVEKLLKLIESEKVFIHFKDKVVRIPGVAFLRTFPELKMASARLTGLMLIFVLINDETVGIEAVPKVRISEEP